LTAPTGAGAGPPGGLAAFAGAVLPLRDCYGRAGRRVKAIE